MMTVNPKIPAKTVKEVIALAQAKPGSLNYGSGGNGSAAHLATEENQSCSFRARFFAVVVPAQPSQSRRARDAS